jgi:chemotaxis family two-component system response regulator Rcp1
MLTMAALPITTNLKTGYDVTKHTAKMTHIMLVEDNPGDVFLVRRALDAEDLEYDILLARDGVEAISYLTQAAQGEREIDLLLVDLNLPKRDGAEVLEQMRLHENLRKVPAIVLTSSNSPQDRQRCMRVGANRYFHKPSNLASFMELGKLANELIGGHEIA